jgi:GT2 family glycosyltransferase
LRQTYDHWELCLVNGGSSSAELQLLLEEHAERDRRIRIEHLTNNLGIAENTYEGLRMAAGEFVAFLDHDDELAPHALFEYVRQLNEDREIDVLYSDEDKLDEQGQRCQPFFKPDWSPEYFRGVMYAGHLLCFRRDLLERAGWLDRRYDGVQDFEFMLRLSEQTSKIRHVPRILYHWRQLPGSIAKDAGAKANISELQRDAVNDHLARRGLPAQAEIASPHHQLRIAPLPQSPPEFVSIIIESKGAPERLEKCLASLYQRSSHTNYEVLLVDAGASAPEAVLELMARFPVRRACVPGATRRARANNVGARFARGKHLLFLNDGMEIVTPDWIEHLVYYAAQPDVGAAGALLLDPGGAVEHAGLALGVGPHGAAVSLMRGFSSESGGYAGSLICAREVSAVAADCLMVERGDFEKIGGFNEHYSTRYDDVDLCLRLHRAGKRIILTPRARLIRHEPEAREEIYDFIDHTLLLDRWQEEIERGDPYYNPNFDPAKTDYSPRSHSALRAPEP